MSRTLVHLVHSPPYGEVPFKNVGLCAVAAGLRAAGFDTRYLDASERLHRQGRDAYDALILRLSERAGDMTDLPRLDLLGEVLFPGEADSPLAATIRAQVDEVAAALAGAEVVGLTFNTLTVYATAALGRALREAGARVVAGGPMSGVPAVSHLLLRLGAADTVVVGEGDLVAAEVVAALESGRGSDVAGALWLDGDAVTGAPPRAGAPALDALPPPELEGNILDDFLPIAATRGCRRGCAYCSEPGIWARRVRRRAPAAVVAEMIERSAATGIRDFHFHDDVLNFDRRWLDALLDGLEPARGELTFESFFEPYGLDRRLVERLAAAGCRLMKLGVQSFSPRLLRIMRRPSRVASIVDALVAAYEAGISTHFDMLVGHPGETDDDHRANLHAIEALYDRTGDRLYFSLNPYYVAAGSAVWRDAAAHGVELVGAALEALPAPLAAAVRRGPAYPERYRSDVPRETTMRRMGELAEILRQHDKDYLYLGQDHVPAAGSRGRRMLQPLAGAAGEASWPALAARAEAVLARGPRTRSLLGGYVVASIRPVDDGGSPGLEVTLARGGERLELAVVETGAGLVFRSPGAPRDDDAQRALRGLIAILERIRAGR
jgi:radical SAM superfamily enzyme YgiQ (UPF0313 family)